jgi:hypothetical protein
MALTKRPPRLDADTFISGAPDAKGQGAAPAPAVSPAPTRAPAATPAASSRKQAISLTIAPALLARVDNAAERLGLSRAAAIALALSRFVDGEDAR